MHLLLLGTLGLSGAHAAPADPPRPQASAGHRFDARLSLYPYPHPVHRLPVSEQGQSLELVYMDIQPRKPNGRVVLLLHGKNFSGAYWATTIEPLVERGFRVIVPDQIGFGKSSKPTEIQYSFHAMATHTARLLDHLAVDDVTVVGHSMGGMLATRFALMFPERASRLVLVNPIGLEDWKRKVPYATVDTLERAARAKTPEAVRAYMQKSYFDGGWKPAYDALAELQMGWVVGPDAARMAKVSALTSDMIFTQPVVHEFGDLRMPTLLVIGDRDRTALGKNRVDADVRATLGRYDLLGPRTHAAIPDSELVVLEGIGHIPQVEAPEEWLRALLGFLDR